MSSHSRFARLTGLLHRPTGLPSLVFVFLVGALLAFQGPKPIPPFEGDGNSMHDGQPKWCSNVDTKEHVHNCACQPMIGDKGCHDPDRAGENPKCSVYCRRKACRCERQCGKTE